jgi:hypothetical protein
LRTQGGMREMQIQLHAIHSRISTYISAFALAMIAVGLLFSRAMISIGFIAFIGNWILEGKFSEKWKLLKSNKTYVLISLIFFIHLLGLVHTSDLERGLKDIQVKLPLLLPIFYFSSPFYPKKKFIDYLILLFATTVTITTIILFARFEAGDSYLTVEDYNQLSFFGSNIRLSLFVNFSIFSLLWYTLIRRKRVAFYVRLLAIITIAWLIFFLYFLNSFTGYFVFTLLFVYSGFYSFKSLDKKLFLRLFIGLNAIIVVSLIYTFKQVYRDFYQKDNFSFNELPLKTVNGNYYIHDTLNHRTENGYYIDLYYCPVELEKEWNKRSHLNFLEKDLKNNELSETLKRYLSSKNLPKDSVGISKLDSSEIIYIEKGCANYIYTKKYSFKAKLHVLFWQIDKYIKTGNATNQSLSQRIEYYKVSYYLIRSNFWFGVGSGDLLQESLKQLERMDSKLAKEFWYIVHNQFISVFSTLGLVGFLLFVLAIFSPFVDRKLRSRYLFVAFYIIMILSFLTDNTLETQLGVSFCSFFYCLTLAYSLPEKE